MNFNTYSEKLYELKGNIQQLQNSLSAINKKLIVHEHLLKLVHGIYKGLSKAVENGESKFVLVLGEGCILFTGYTPINLLADLQSFSFNLSMQELSSSDFVEGKHVVVNDDEKVYCYIFEVHV